MVTPRRKARVIWALPALAALAAAGAAADDPRPAAQAAAAAATAGASPGKITLELIMSDPEWIGLAPENPYWSDDGNWVYFESTRLRETHPELLRIPAAGGVAETVRPEELGAADAAGGELSRDRRLKTYARNGDVFVKDLASGEVRQLTRTAAEESDPRFLLGGRRVAFHRDGDIFVRDLESGLETQPADLRLEKDPAEEEEEEEDAGYLARQQTRLFDVVRERQDRRRRERDKERNDQRADPSRPPLPWYLGDDLEIREVSLAPSGDRMLLVVMPKERDDGKKDPMPSWVTDSGHVESQEVRARVGTADGTGERLLLLDLVRRQRHELDLTTLPGITDDPLAELRAAARERERERQRERVGNGEPAGETEDGDEDDPEGESDDNDSEPEARAVRFEEPAVWSFDGEHVAVQAHSYDNKDRWIAVASRGSAELRPVHRLSHEAWINWHFNDYGWLPDGHTLYYLSEESGTSQLYVHSLEDGSRRRLSAAGSVVSDPEVGPEGKYVYYAANPDHPGVYEIYRSEVASGEIEQLTRLGGVNSAELSADGRQLLITHSTTVHPPELYVQEARSGAPARRLTHTVSEAFTSLPWVRPEIVAVPSSHHNRPIISRFYAPAATRDLPAGGRPAVIFVHGAGYLQNAHQGWSGYFREFMFHTVLTHNGYLVLDMDYRASAGYGVDWRTAVYRQMGTPELEDLADGVAWLADHHDADRRRVGVYGGSYGGFLTMMALFKEPDLFACGAALRPVTDWAHYNHSYTSNILNTPDVDPEAYERSSPIGHAAGLSRPLLICAPMLDDNVFFQDTVRLAQRLIELGKEDWELAVYPVEPHGFRQPSSWLDEYRRIFKLFESCLKP